MPLVSVVLPVYGFSKYLKEAIDSILNQTLKDIELIIIEDPKNKKYENEKLIKSYKDKRIKYIKNRRREGLVNSLNIAISHSNSNYIARQDADDISLPNRLELQYNSIKKEKAAVVGSCMFVIDEKNKIIGRRSYPTNPTEIRRKFLLRDFVAHPTVMFDKKIITSLGGYDPKMLHVEDYALWLKVLNAGHKIINLPDCLVKYRHHKGAIKYKYLRETTKNTMMLQIKALRQYKNLPKPPQIIFYLFLEAFLILLPKKISYFLFEKFSVK